MTSEPNAPGLRAGAEALGDELGVPRGKIAARRPTIGIGLYGDLTFDSRVRREASTLARSGYDVVVVCLAASSDQASTDLPDNVRVVVSRPDHNTILPGSPNPFSAASGGRFALLMRRLSWLRGYIMNLRAWGKIVPDSAGPVDAWHLNDFVALAAVARHLPKGVPVVYDAHDLFLETGTALLLPSMARSLLKIYERRLISSVSAVITVNSAVAMVIQSRYRPRRIEVVYNCPDQTTPSPQRPTLIRDLTGIPLEAPVILHHGRLGERRGIEQLMLALLEPGLESAHLVLMGFGEKRLQYQATGQEPRFAGRVHVLEPVAPAVLLDWVASATIGAMPIQPATLNLYLSTPNKLFESLAAGIPVVASDFPAMREILLDPLAGPLGAVCDPSDPASIAAAIRSILALTPDDAVALRARCLEASRTRWNWQVESTRLVALYDDLTRA